MHILDVCIHLPPSLSIHGLSLSICCVLGTVQALVAPQGYRKMQIEDKVKALLESVIEAASTVQPRHNLAMNEAASDGSQQE